MAAAGLSFTADSGWHRECVRRPEVMSYVYDLTCQAQEGNAWAQAPWMAFSSGLLAGVRLASEPGGNDDQIKTEFEGAVETFSQAGLGLKQHNQIGERYERSLQHEESKLGYNRHELLSMELKRDARAEAFVHTPYYLLQMSASESVLAAFQAGLIAGAQLLAMGYINRGSPGLR